LNSPAGAAFIEGYRDGSVAQRLNLPTIRSLPVLVPPLVEQSAIAEIVGALDDKCEANRLAANKAEDLARTIPMSELPSVTVGSIAAVSRKLVPTSFFANRQVEYFSLPAFDANHLPTVESGDGIKSGKFLIEQRTVLVSKLNPHIPRVWMATPSGAGPAITSTEFIGLLPAESYAVETLWALCSSTRFASRLRESVKGTTGSHQRVTAEDVLAIEVPDPKSFSDAASATIQLAVQLAGSLRRESTRLAALRDALLPKLLSGEIRVSEAEELVGKAI
jgi:type I restriction enzyme S subunit